MQRQLGGLVRRFGVGKSLVVVAAFVLACAAADASAVAAPADQNAISGRVIRYLSLGDSVSDVSPSFVDTVAKQAGASLHAKVTVARVVEEDTVATLVRKINSSASLRRAIREADLVTITLGANEIGAAADRMAPGACGSSDGSACVVTAEKNFERSYAALLTKLRALRPPSQAAYRLLTSYNTPGVFPAAKGGRSPRHFAQRTSTSAVKRDVWG